MTTTYQCSNDRYCSDLETFASVEEFLTMCTECFGEQPDLRPGTERDGTDVWLDECDEVALREIHQWEVGIEGDDSGTVILDAATADEVAEQMWANDEDGDELVVIVRPAGTAGEFEVFRFASVDGD
jgi:hypothetical protein